MNIPKYVQELMGRSRYEYSPYYYNKYHDSFAAGYTIRIIKSSPYSHVDGFCSEIVRLKKWVERQPGGECIFLEIPKQTHYCTQYAVVTIFDPVMKHIENYIPSEEEWKRRHV